MQRTCTLSRSRRKTRVPFWLLLSSLGLVLFYTSCSNDSPSPRQDNQTPDTAATAFSSFGAVLSFENFPKTEQLLGWRVLRRYDERFTLVQQGGLIRTFPEIGLPRLEQAYTMVGLTGLIEFTQEPDNYKWNEQPGTRDMTIGRWSGRFQQAGRDYAFAFPTGESVGGHPIRAEVVARTKDAMQAFVEALDFAR